ncbi:MAG: hypothetical protein HQL83_01580 [Magnetococcales bacterium]|nr:hypothetical protein [Magnetococcales bacterium]MBF0629890.1 hypothetical protein [Magnetococcales bacterium]
MVESRVVDTNVLIVASAADDGSPFRPDATPVEEAQLREIVLKWFQNFERDAKRYIVLDHHWLILTEYGNKLNVDQDYAYLAMMAKQDRGEVLWVGFEVDPHGHAVLPVHLANSVTDRADRKMVAAALSALNSGNACKLTNACDSDWLDCTQVLKDYGVEVEQLLEEWLLQQKLKKNKNCE